MPYVVERIVAQGKAVNADRVFIPTGPRTAAFSQPLSLTPAAGFQSKNLIVDGGLVLGDIEQYPKIDVTIDGADECVSLSRNPSSPFLFVNPRRV